MRALVAALIVSTWSAVAGAETPQEVETAPPTPALTPEERKDPASYRGRTNHTDAGDVLVWPPRVVLAPLYVVTEYGIRLPVYETAAWLDRNHVIPIIDDILNPTPDISWHPIVAFDLGVFAAGGAGLEVRNMVARDNTFKLVGELGSPDAWLVSARDTWTAGPVQLGLHGTAFSRLDRSFFGFGPHSGSDAALFSQRRFEGFVFAGFDAGDHLHVDLSEGFRSDRIGHAAKDSIDELFPKLSIPIYGETDLAMARVDLRLDSREERDQSGGARLLGNLTYGRDVRDAERAFLSTELDAEAAVEVSYPDRVLALRGYFMDTFPLGREPVPLLEQAMLGSKIHYGFIWGRFRDESAAMLELRYRYPIAYFVDMHWIASAGNVFSRNLSDFDVSALTGSLGVGLRTRRTGHRPLELIFALGSTRFDEPFSIQSVRFVLSSTEGL